MSSEMEYSKRDTCTKRSIWNLIENFFMSGYIFHHKRMTQKKVYESSATVFDGTRFKYFTKKYFC